MSFQPDVQVRSKAEGRALEAVRFAKTCFNIDLDWSENSVRHIEAILDHIHKEMPRVKLSQPKIAGMGEVLGSYIGEVFRRHHGGEWGIVELQGQTFPGMRLEPSKGECWPWGRVQNRVVNGSEDNVWHYYQFLIGQARPDSALKAWTDGPLPTKSQP